MYAETTHSTVGSDADIPSSICRIIVNAARLNSTVGSDADSTPKKLVVSRTCNVKLVTVDNTIDAQCTLLDTSQRKARRKLLCRFAKVGTVVISRNCRLDVTSVVTPGKIVDVEGNRG